MTGLGLAAAATAGGVLRGGRAEAETPRSYTEVPSGGTSQHAALAAASVGTGNVNYRGQWQAYTGYSAYDEVSVYNQVYICTNGHTSGGYFTPANWSQVGVGHGAYVAPNVYGATSYPPRPAYAGTVIYTGSGTPTDAVTGDIWVPPTSTPADIGAEVVANKGAPNGYMGLDGSRRGTSPPQAHLLDHAPGGASDLHLFGGSESAYRHENMPRHVAAGNRTLSVPAWTAWFMFFTARTNMTFTRLFAVVGAVGSSGSSLQRLALYVADGSNNLTKVAQTAANPTMFATPYSFVAPPLATNGSDGFPTSYTLAPGQRYAIGIIHAGSNVAPSFFGVDLSAMAGLPPLQAATLSSQGDAAYGIGGASLQIQPFTAYCGVQA